MIRCQIVCDLTDAATLAHVPPPAPPLGLRLVGAAKKLRQAFDDALAEAGGSLPVWLVLLMLKTRSTETQNELAEAVGIRGATLTHHLAAMERDGLVHRRRDPANRRVQLVELTEAGDQAFHRLRQRVMAFDRRLRSGISPSEVTRFHRVLDRLEANVASVEPSTAARQM